MEQVHLIVMVLHFAWTALSDYARTPNGQADLADIEAVLYAIENPHTSTASTPSGSSSASTTGPQVIRPK